jgi:hypothetical protein
VWTPCKRRDFIKKIKGLGFDGPYSGSKHEFMVFGEHRLAIPSNKEYSIPELRMMMREVEKIVGRPIDSSEWNSL